MSAYSDWRAEAITDDEYKFYTTWEARRDHYYEMLAYLEANIDDFPDYHEIIEAALEMKGDK